MILTLASLKYITVFLLNKYFRAANIIITLKNNSVVQITNLIKIL